MALTPKLPTPEAKDLLSLRLEREVHERLQQYVVFVAGHKDYVISQALRLLFRKDREFAAWLESRAMPPTGHAPSAAASEDVPVPTTAGSRQTSDPSRGKAERR